jgi:hypothetical protein
MLVELSFLDPGHYSAERDTHLRRGTAQVGVLIFYSRADGKINTDALREVNRTSVKPVKRGHLGDLAKLSFSDRCPLYSGTMGT